MRMARDSETTKREIDAKTDAAISRLLRVGDIERPRFPSALFARYLAFVVSLAACFIGAVAYHFWAITQPDTTNLPNAAQLVTAAVAALASGFAFYQWVDAPRQVTNEKFYERIEITTRQFMQHEFARGLVPHFWAGKSGIAEGKQDGEADFQRALYVYLEIDNLEYMIGRYQQGHAREELFLRAARMFVSRCESEEFCDLAILLVKRAGYSDKTVKVVTEFVLTTKYRRIAGSAGDDA